MIYDVRRTWYGDYHISCVVHFTYAVHYVLYTLRTAYIVCSTLYAPYTTYNVIRTLSHDIWCTWIVRRTTYRVHVKYNIRLSPWLLRNSLLRKWWSSAFCIPFVNRGAEMTTVNYVQSTLYSIQCTLYSVHCKVCTVYTDIYSWLCSGNYAQGTHSLYRIQYTLYSVQCALYSVYYAVYTV